MKLLNRYKTYFLCSLVGISLLLLLSCGKESEAKYEGLPLTVWIERITEGDALERLDALRVVTEIGSPAMQIERIVRDAARNETHPQIKLQAIKALEAMGAPIVEFRDFINLYEAPLFPSEEEEYVYNPDLEEEEEMLANASGADDLEYLRTLSEGGVIGSFNRGDTSMIPSDEDSLTMWTMRKRFEIAESLLSQLRNPHMLSNILQIGGVEERLFAAKSLASQSGVDKEIHDALSAALDDSDPRVREAVREALNNWILP